MRTHGPNRARTLAFFLIVCLPGTAQSADPNADRASKKFYLIDSGRAKPGSVIVFTPMELNAWARLRVPEKAAGVREPRITLGNGTATVAAMVDFVKLRADAGHQTNSAIAKLLEGERSLQVSASLETGAGRATVHLTRAEIGGVAITGSALDFLVNTVFRPMFPEAHINEPFDLMDNIEHINIQPSGVRVAIRR